MDICLSYTSVTFVLFKILSGKSKILLFSRFLKRIKNENNLRFIAL